jgi:cardiolipin synthase
MAHRAESKRAGADHDGAEYRTTLEATLGIPFTPGNAVRVLRNGDQIFPAMLAAIRAARESVEFLTFVYWTGEIAVKFAAALAERASAGVSVRIILDAIGAAPMDRRLVRLMENAGVTIVWFRKPLRWKLWQIDHRTHRKVLVVDGRIGFTGGVGIAAEWEGDARNPCEWRDTHFEVRGPAVHGLRGAFIDNWVEADQPLGPVEVTGLDEEGEALVQVMKGSAAVNWSAIATLFHALLTTARRKLRIATAYFVPDAMMVQLLVRAARRGVDVQILIPGPHMDERLAELAQEHTYIPMIEAGVRIFAFQPCMMHAKILTVDDTVAAVGSANFNQRSMSKDDELVMLVMDAGVLATLDRQFDEDLTRSLELDATQLRHRGPLRRLESRFVSLFRHEM